MPGAVPRARGEEVTVGVSLPQSRSRRAATAQCPHGSQCDWTPVFSKAWIQGEKSQQARETRWCCCCEHTACAISAWLCSLQGGTHTPHFPEPSSAGPKGCAVCQRVARLPKLPLGQTDPTVLLPGMAASCTVVVMEQLVLPRPGFCLI